MKHMIIAAEVDEKLAKRTMALAKELGLSRSDILRNALRAFIGDADFAAAERERKKAGAH